MKWTTDKVQQGLTKVAGFFVGSREVSVELILKNTDLDLRFDGNSPSNMVQAWGTSVQGFGQGLKIPGITVRAGKKVFLSKGTLGSDNKATVSVLDGVGADVCLTMDNDAASLTGPLFIPEEVCDFVYGSGEYSIPNDNNTSYSVGVCDPAVNILAQFTDGAKYMEKVVGLRMEKADVIHGTTADRIGQINGGRAFAGCLGLYGGIMSVYDIALELSKLTGKMPKSWLVNKLSSATTTEMANASKAINDIQVAVDRIGAVVTELSAVYPGQPITTHATEAQTAIKATAATAKKFLNDLRLFKQAEEGSKVAKEAADESKGKEKEAERDNAAKAAARNMDDALDIAEETGKSLMSQLDTAASAFTTLYDDLSRPAPDAGSPDGGTGGGYSQAVKDGIARSYQSVKNAKERLKGTSDFFAEAAGTVAEINNITGSSALLVPGTVIVDLVLGFYATSDIIMPDSDLTEEPSPTSRGVATHEYGHFALCNMLASGPTGFEVLKKAYGEVAAAMLVAGGDPDSEGSYINEAFADFFVSELTGGMSCFRPASGKPDKPRTGHFYCTDTAASCFEDNIGAPGSRYPYNPNSPTQRDEIARVVTTLHDVFDRWQVVTPPAEYKPSIAAVWSWTGVPADRVSMLNFQAPSEDDEVVNLEGSALRKIVENMTDDDDHIRQDPLMSGINTVMKDARYRWCARCEIFRRHTPGADCPAEWMDARPTGLRCQRENCVSPDQPSNDRYRMCVLDCPPGQEYDRDLLRCIPHPAPRVQ